MSKTNVKVHALPTTKASNIISHKSEFKYYRNPMPPISDDLAIPHFLYATTSETPKKGDWCVIDLAENTRIVQIKSLNGNHPIFNVDIGEGYAKLENLRKVVATDDKSLTLEGLVPTGRIEKGIPLPQISPSFQEAWVREADKGTPIIDAMMEMEEVFRNNGQGGNMPENFKRISLVKLNPQGFVTILPVKEKIYTKEDIKVLCYEWYKKGINQGIKPTTKPFHEMFDENL